MKSGFLGPKITDKRKRAVIAAVIAVFAVAVCLSVALPLALSPRGKGLIIENGVLTGYEKDAERVVVPESVREIADGVFEGKENLKKIVFKGKIERLGNYAFKNSKITEITLEEGLKEIGEGCFYGCGGLKNIIIPSSVEKIGEGAFAYCKETTSVSVRENGSFISKNGLLLSKDGSKLLAYPLARNGKRRVEITLPDGITEIGSFAFAGMESLDRVNFPNGLKAVNKSAFHGCVNLMALEFPNTLESIGDYAFFGAEKITSLSLPSNVEEIGYAAIGGFSSLLELEIPFVGRYGDGRLSALSVTPAAADRCFGYVFGSEYYENSHLAAQYYDYDKYKAFRLPSSLKKVTVTACESVGDGGFYGCEILERIKLPENIKALGFGCFAYCESLTEIELPKSLESIGNRAFYYAKALKKLVLGEKIASLGRGAFAGCYELCEMVSDEKNPYFKYVDGMLYSVNDKSIVFCLPNKSGVIDLSLFPEKIEKLEAYAFYGSKATRIRLSAEITEIGDYAFYEARELEIAELSARLLKIGARAFFGCEKLKSVVLPLSLLYLGAEAFFGCEGLCEINCEAESKPKDWDTEFDVKAGQSTLLREKHKVVWGYGKE